MKKELLIFMHKSQESAGFTLVEIIVAIGIFAIIILFLPYLGVYHYWIYNTQIAQFDVISDARGTLDDMDSYVRQSNRVISNYLTYTTDSQTLILQIQSIDPSNNLIAGTYDNVVFYLSGSDFFRQVFPSANSKRLAATKKLASNVTEITFSYDNLNYSLVQQVTTTISVQQNLGKDIKSATLSSQAKLRNY